MIEFDPLAAFAKGIFESEEMEWLCGSMLFGMALGTVAAVITLAF